MRLLLHELLHPFPAVTIDGLLVPEEHGIVVVGVGGDDLALQGRVQVVVGVAGGRGAAQGLGVGQVAEGIHEDAGPGAGLILEAAVDVIPAARLVGQKTAFTAPARKVLQRLQLHHVGHDLAIGKLLVQPGVVHLAVVHHHVQGHAREALLEGGLDAVELVGRIAARIDHQRAAFLQGFLVDLIERSAFNLGGADRLAEQGQRDSGEGKIFLHGWVWLTARSRHVGGTGGVTRLGTGAEWPGAGCDDKDCPATRQLHHDDRLERNDAFLKF